MTYQPIRLDVLTKAFNDLGFHRTANDLVTYSDKISGVDYVTYDAYLRYCDNALTDERTHFATLKKTPYTILAITEALTDYLSLEMDF